MIDKGWVKIHRQILDWEWYSNPIVSRLFFHLLIKANHTEKQWQGVTIVRGSFITSYPILAQETGFTVMQVRTALAKLKSTGEITVKTTSKYSVISINKYDCFQSDNRQDDSPVTGKQQASNRQVTTTKNEKNEKNEKKNSGELEQILKLWNSVYGSAFRATQPIMANYTYWRETYSVAEIEKAIRNSRKDTFWEGKLNPVVFFRKKNPQGEDVDRIGEFLNATHKVNSSHPQGLKQGQRYAPDGSIVRG